MILMSRPLDYEVTQSNPVHGKALALVIVLPVAAVLVLFIAMLHNIAEEPFGIFRVVDVAVQVGGPVAAILFWLAWYWVARVRRRLPWLVLAPAMCFGLLNIWVAAWFIIEYFREPWNS